MRKSDCWIALILAFCVALPAVALQPMTQKQQQSLTPTEALTYLKEGNQRFVNNKMNKYNFKSMRKHNVKGQHPLAIVLACLDSRSAPDITFDQPLGNIFVARVAGNVISSNMLGSMEFGTKLAGAKLIVVMGHTRCGAIAGACKGVDSPNNLKSLLSEIQPAVATVAKHKAKQCDNDQYIDQIAKQNVIDQVDSIYQKSPTIKNLVDEKKIMLVGAMHNLKTGAVNFFYMFKPNNT